MGGLVEELRRNLDDFVGHEGTKKRLIDGRVQRRGVVNKLNVSQTKRGAVIGKGRASKAPIVSSLDRNF
jgi:hypothetical protein